MRAVPVQQDKVLRKQYILEASKYAPEMLVFVYQLEMTIGTIMYSCKSHTTI